MTGIDRSAAPAVLVKGAPDPVPALLLGRLAVDRRYTGLGIGTALAPRPRDRRGAQRESRMPRRRRHRPQPERSDVVGATRVSSVLPQRPRRARPLPTDIRDRRDPPEDPITVPWWPRFARLLALGPRYLSQGETGPTPLSYAWPCIHAGPSELTSPFGSTKRLLSALLTLRMVLARMVSCRRLLYGLRSRLTP